MYSTTEIKISKTALLHHYVNFCFRVVFLFCFFNMCYEIYFADIKDLGVGFMVVFLNQVFTWRFGQCTNSGTATLSNTKAVLTVKLHQ